MKVLHILDHYKPHFSGYVFRTSYILKYQKEFGIQPVVVTSPKHGASKRTLEKIDNIRVYRTLPNNFGRVPFVKEALLMRVLQKRIEEILDEEQPDIIHAHSPSLNGIPALMAGRKYGIPVVYEVRALWEDAAVDHGTFTEKSLRYKVSRLIETELLKRADSLFTICDGLKREMISRGLPPEKITVIPNCVDTDIFSPQERDREMMDRYSLRDKVVCGFIGSFYHYEGIDLLIEGYIKMFRDRDDVGLLLVGDGPAIDDLYRKVSENNLNGRIIFTGKVSHQDVKRYYSVIDILVYPRKKMRLTELVTPLKPLEAMAMGKVVVGSDVGGIKELIIHNKNGFLFSAGNIEELAGLLKELVSRKEKINEISKTAIETIRNRHRWDVAVRDYIRVYKTLVGRKCAVLQE
jgi:PEP-CTERM/exosortase A-associated glycosyltransferase